MATTRSPFFMWRAQCGRGPRRGRSKAKERCCGGVVNANAALSTRDETRNAQTAQQRVSGRVAFLTTPDPSAPGGLRGQLKIWPCSFPFLAKLIKKKNPGPWGNCARH